MRGELDNLPAMIVLRIVCRLIVITSRKLGSCLGRDTQLSEIMFGLDDVSWAIRKKNSRKNLGYIALTSARSNAGSGM